MVTILPLAQREYAGRLVREAQDIVAKHPVFRGRRIKFQFRVEGDAIVVRGKLPSFYLKQVLQNALKRLSGIRYIDNQVSVISSEGLSEPC